MAIGADDLRELIIFTMIENAQVVAAVMGTPPVLDLEWLGASYDKALDEINQCMAEQRRRPIETSLDFKTTVIDTLVRRMEAAGRVRGT